MNHRNHQMASIMIMANIVLIITHTHTYIHTYMHAYIHTCMHPYIHTYASIILNIGTALQQAYCIKTDSPKSNATLSLPDEWSFASGDA